MREYTTGGHIDRENRTANLHGVTVSLDEPTTGVIGNNGICQFLSDEVFGGDSIDLGWESVLAEFQAENGREPDDDEWEEIAENYAMCESGPHLIGDWKKDEETGEWEPDRDREDGHGYSAIVREDVTQVIWSRTTKRAHYCSPCYPGQVDIDTDGEYLGYTLPEDCFDEEF